MHSKIVKLYRYPSSPMLNLDDYDYGFIGDDIDYIAGDDDPKKTVDIFLEQFNERKLTRGTNDQGDWIIFEDGFDDLFMLKRWVEFREALRRLERVDTTDFASRDDDGIAFDLWKLRMAYDDDREYWIETDGRLMTLSQFIRTCDRGEKYYIRGTLDYHY